MKTLYLDCFAGISGDMLAGALLNLIPDHGLFRAEIAKLTALTPEDYRIDISKGLKNGISGLNFDVHTHEHHPHRGLHEVEDIVRSSSLSARIQDEVMKAFAVLAEAEANVHGTTPDKIHFHEVGAIDSIIDIVSVFILMDLLGWPRVICSPLNVGSGTVKCAHGVLPVPAPATELILHGVPIYSAGSPMERTTPTGALLAKSLAQSFCTVPEGKIINSGYGLGDRTSEDLPNVLRVLLIDTADNKKDNSGLIKEHLCIVESNIDDMNPQDYEPVCIKLFEQGALDVWLEPVYMKKGRPAVRFCCLCRPDRQDDMVLTMIKNTTTQGVRIIDVNRARLDYRIDKAKTSLGDINIKTAILDGRELRHTPEYEDLKRIANEHDMPVSAVRSRVAQELKL